MTDDASHDRTVRTEAASLLRELGHLIVERDLDPQYLSRLAEDALDLVKGASKYPIRARTADDLLAENSGPTPSDGDPMEHYAACPVTGQENPLGLGISVRREGDAAVARTVFGPATTGMPGVAHGGVVAAVFDDLMGFVLTKLNGLIGVTATMTVTYRAPVPIGPQIEFRSWLAHRNGRKLSIEGAAYEASSQRLLAEATGLFIEVPAESFTGLSEPRASTGSI